MFGYGSKLSSRIQCGREVGVVGSLATRGVVVIDWTGVWKAVIVKLFPIGAAGGIRPTPRRRSRLALTLSEREAISRGIVAQRPIRAMARLLGRSPSAVSREVRRRADRLRRQDTLRSAGHHHPLTAARTGPLGRCLHPGLCRAPDCGAGDLRFESPSFGPFFKRSVRNRSRS